MPLPLLIIIALGCRFFSEQHHADFVFPPTEIGTPQGDKVISEIGPAGGAISTPDGRLTLTIPANAVSGNTAFSIQPISNTAQDGIGLAYRLEPGGQAFAKPLEVSIRFNDDDVQTTYPGALRLAYQDQSGAWHEQGSTVLDATKLQVSFSTTHLSDWALKRDSYVVSRPGKVVLRPGESVGITVERCERLMTRFEEKKREIPYREENKRCSNVTECQWSLKGPGTLVPGAPQVVYTAPMSPTPATALALCKASFWPGQKNSAFTEIVIAARGYRAHGTAGDMTITGVICRLDKPFTLHGNIINYTFRFTPSTETTGSVDITAAGMSVTAKGGAIYEIWNLYREKPVLKVTGAVEGHSPVGDIVGSGWIYLDLFPIDTDECDGKN